MKLRFFLGLALLVAYNSVFCQKKPLTNDSYKDWEELTDEYKISPDGAYVLYGVKHYSASSDYYLYNTSSHQTIAYQNIRGEFSSDGKKFIYQRHDSLTINQLCSDDIFRMNGLTSFKLVKSKRGDILLISFNKRLQVKDLKLKTLADFDNVIDYKINKQGTMMLVRTDKSLSILMLNNLKIKMLVNGSSYGEIVFDESGSEVAFTASKNEHFSLYRYHIGDSRAELIAADKDKRLNGLTLSGTIRSFSSDGCKLYFNLKSEEGNLRDTFSDTTKAPRIWSYKDIYAKSSDLFWRSRPPNQFLAVADLKATRAILQLENDSIKVLETGNRYILRHPRMISESESYFNKEWKDYSVLFDIISGKTFSKKFPPQAILSPGEKYITWGDFTKGQLNIYNINTGEQIAATGRKLVKGWKENDEALLVEQSFGPFHNRSATDLMFIDPLTGKIKVNVTGGYGEKNNVIFENALYDLHRDGLLTGGNYLLKGANSKTKADGFYSINLEQEGSLKKLFSAPMLISSEGHALVRYNLKRAGQGKGYVFAAQTASQSANLYFTKDFKTVSKISDIHPEKNYNWMKSELITYPQRNGIAGTAILYKPENFDPEKKYPVLFYYYEEYTSGLHACGVPSLSVGQLSIPWYVSNGYLVCVPDIIKTDGKVHIQTTLNSVEGAAEYLKEFNWVDGTHMGIQGHSFGGYETGLLLANSKLFAAAQPSAGIYDLVSARGQIIFGNPGDSFLEKAQLILGTTLWEDPQSYFRNSAILKTPDVKVPVLLMHGNLDFSVPFAQAVEFITALRRLQKPSWLLEYNSGHTLTDEAMQLDFTIKQQQFFGHYLKGEPMPDWMK